MTRGYVLKGEELQRHHELQQMLFEFAQLFDYNEASDRAIAIVGPAYLDAQLRETLINFFVKDKREVEWLVRPEGPLGTFGSRVTACYCLGLVNETVKNDLRLIGRIRNRFAHDLRATFSDRSIEAWCRALNWHRVAMFHEPPFDATTRDFFQVGVHTLVAYLSGVVGIARQERRARQGTIERA